MSESEIENRRKTGEMFTASFLKKASPLYQFLFSLGFSLLVMFLAKGIWHSDEMIKYGGSFGVVFFVMFNPWLSLLHDDNKKYFVQSIIFYSIIAVVLYGLIYLWTGISFSNSMEVSITLITTTFYMVVAFGMMTALKYLCIDQSGGGL